MEAKICQITSAFLWIKESTLTSKSGDIRKEYMQLHCQLEDIESTHSVHGRWRQSSQEYQECLHSLAMEKWEVILISLLKNRQKREFLLNMKKKYADGQKIAKKKIAKKLSRQIAKETSSMKCLLNEYNDMCTSSSACDFLSLSDALSNGVIEGRLQGLGASCCTISNSNCEIVDAYLLLTRAKSGTLTLCTSVFGSGTLTLHTSVFGSGTLTLCTSVFGSGTLTLCTSVFGSGTLTLRTSVFGSGTLTLHTSVFGSGTLTLCTSVFGSGTLTLRTSVFGSGTLTLRTSVFGSGTLTLHTSVFGSGTLMLRTSVFGSGTLTLRTSVFGSGTLTLRTSVFGSGTLTLRTSVIGWLSGTFWIEDEAKDRNFLK